MKILRVYPPVDSTHSAQVFICSDTARCNSDRRFYLPHDHQYECMPCAYYVMDGICKGVNAESAMNYISRVGYALHLVDRTLLDALTEAHELLTPAVSYDRSIIAGEGYACVRGILDEPVNVGVCRFVDQQVEYRLELPANGQLSGWIASCTSWLTLHTGDWLLVPLLPSPIPVHRPCRVQIDHSPLDLYSLDEVLY